MNLRTLLTRWRHRNTPTPAAPEPPRLREYQLIDRREHCLSMWCENPYCEGCTTEIGPGECIETAEIVNGGCSCKRWSCKAFGDLEVLVAFNGHLREVQHAANRQAARSGVR